MIRHLKKNGANTRCRKVMHEGVTVTTDIDKCNCAHCLVIIIENSQVYERVQKARKQLDTLQNIINCNTGC